MNIKRATALALSLSLLLGAAACGKSNSEAADTGSKTSAELLEEENAILDAHQKLWDQVFASMDKSSPATAENYGDVLLSALENCRDSLSDGDYQTLKSDAESIRSIEEQIAALPADDSAGQSETAAASAFPEFTGKDLDGNAVDNSLFANNAYTVVNFWFSGCKPCVAELGELDKLNQTAKQQGGEVIGINAAKYSSTEVEGMGYAIPVSQAQDIINELTSVIKKVKNSKSHIRRVTVLRELHSAATMATCITAINECTVSNHEISDTDATEGMNVAAVAAPVTETYALNTTAGDVQATAGAFIASATGTEGSTYVLNDNQGATEASGTIDVGPVNASEESTHALNAETGKADLSQSERAAMRANIDYQTTTVIKEE